MAKHYYNIELVTTAPLDEDEIQELEDLLRARYAWKVTTEYIDSEG